MKQENNRLILDCTLRDGGYVNNWEFDTETAIQVRDALYHAGVRYIELGLMARGGVPGKHTKFASFEEVEPLLVDRKQDCHYCVMVTQAEYTAQKMSLPSCSDKTPDVIRLAYFQPEMDEALNTARIIMEKGYTVFLQAMATFMYSETELAAMIEKINQMKPTAFYMVDSFSTMYNDDVRKMEHFVLSRLDPKILFGFHAHNNIQMAYSNVIEFMNYDTERTLFIDGSIYGMGRGAGNVPTELLMEYMNKKAGAEYQIKPILGAFEKYIYPIFQKYYWGYSLPYYLTASKDMNSVYGWYLSRKGVAALEDIDAILDRIPVEAKYTLMKDAADKAIAEYSEEKGK